MAGVFISYRREDTSGQAGRLHADLESRFGKGRVFLDIEDIEPGVNFVDRLAAVVSSSDAVVCLIGRRWLTVTDSRGQRRIEDPTDFVNVEVASALRENVRLVPVLVGGASMPAPEELPADLRPLAHLNAVEVSDTRWNYDVGRLVDALGGRGLAARRRRRRLVATVSAVILLVALVSGGILLALRPSPQGNTEGSRGGSSVPTFDGVSGHLRQAQALVTFIDRHDGEPVHLNAGFQVASDDFSVEGFGTAPAASNGDSAITLYTECTPALSAPEKRRVDLGFTKEVMGSGRCMYTSLHVGRAQKDESRAYVTHGNPRIEGYFMVDVGDLAQGETMVTLSPLSFREATQRAGTSPASKGPGPSGSTEGRSEDWPARTSAWTVVLASERSRAAAKSVAARASDLGLEQTGILSSDNHSSLQGGYWVAYSGVLERSEAQDRASQASERGLSGAYARFVSGS